MLSNLLTALGVAALSIQTPSNIQPQEPKRAYYDSSRVETYGTEQSHIYNYAEEMRLGAYYQGEEIAGTSSAVVWNENQGLKYTYEQGSNRYYYTNSEYKYYWLPQDQELNKTYDYYVNGVYSGTFSSVIKGGGSVKYYEGPSFNGLTGYIWIFEHYDPNMSETIAEVVGDATTAAASVLGSGISGAISLFYNNGITGLGIIALILTGVSLVWFAFSLILRLWRRR